MSTRGHEGGDGAKGRGEQDGVAQTYFGRNVMEQRRGQMRTKSNFSCYNSELVNIYKRKHT